MTVCTLALLLSLHNAASVQDSAAYTLLPERSDNVEQVINQVTARMNFLMKPIIRSRLRATNAPYKNIVIVERSDSNAISYDGRAPIRAPADGTAVPWRREDGERFQIWIKREGDVLRHHFKANDGERINEFTWTTSDTLNLNVTLNSPRLPEPVRYKLVYVREN